MSTIYDEGSRLAYVLCEMNIFTLFKGKLTFPWNIYLNEMSFGTLLEVGACKSLLKPLSADCTIGVSIKEGKNNCSVIALCVHSNFQPICFTLTNKQVSSRNMI